MSANPNNSPKEKQSWKEMQDRKAHGCALPRNAIAFWMWGRVGQFHSPSKTEGAFKVKPSNHPRRLHRSLSAKAVHRAEEKSKNAKHQFKFLNRSKREAFLLKKIATR